MLKKTTVLAATIAAALMLGACSKSDSSQAAASAPAAEKAYVVATDATYAPFEYLDNNQVVGFSKDILEAIAANQGIKFDLPTRRGKAFSPRWARATAILCPPASPSPMSAKGRWIFPTPILKRRN